MGLFMIGEDEKKLINVWKDLYEKHGYPCRKNLNPISFISLLPNVFIMERVLGSDPHDYVVRLAGTNLEKMAGVTLKGIKSSEFNDPESDKFFRDSFEKSINVPCGASFYRTMTSPKGREIGITLFALPVKGKTEETPQILFYIRYDTDAGYLREQGDFRSSPIQRFDFIDLGCGLPK